MTTEIRTGYRRVGRGKSSRNLSNARYVGTLAIYEDGQHLYSYTGNIRRIAAAAALEDARIEAESLASQNPTVDIRIA